MRLRAALFLLSVLWLLSLGPTATADDRPLTVTLSPQINSYYSVKASYLEKQAYIGNRNLVLTITMNSTGVVPESGRLTLAGVESFDEPRIKITHIGSGGDGIEQQFRVDIPDDQALAPRLYKLTVEFRDQKQTRIQRQVDLNVGSQRTGKLRLVETGRKPLILGERTPFTVRLANDYSDYTVSIKKIAVNLSAENSPADLIEGLEEVHRGDGVQASVSGNEITFTPGVSIDPGGAQGQVNLLLKLKSWPSLMGWATGYGDDTRLTLDVTYDDGHERTIYESYSDIKVKVRPGDRLLLWTMLLGVLAGTFIKFYLEYLRKKGGVSRKGVAWFVAITVVVGVVITIIAWAGEIQITAFKDIKLSYDKPSVIFTIGLAGALSGVHYMQKLLKKLTGDGS
jgi:hypothetical protein